MELTWQQLMHVMEKITDQAQNLIRLAKQLQTAINQEKVDIIGRLVIEQEQGMKIFEDLEDKIRSHISLKKYIA